MNTTTTTRRAIRAALPAAALLPAACVLLAACGGPSHPAAAPRHHAPAHQTVTEPVKTTGTQPASNQPASDQPMSEQTTAQQTSTTLASQPVQTVQEWGQDNCLHTYVTANNQVLSDTPTSLCRQATTSDGQTVYLAFQRGQSASNWVVAFEVPGDGYEYWRYPDSYWLRQPVSGGPDEIKVRYQDGSLGYQNLRQWEAASNEGNAEASRLTTDNQTVTALMDQVYTTQVNTGDLSQTQLTQAEQELQAKDQQIAQLQQQAQQTQQASSNAQFLTDEEEYLTDSNMRMAQVWTEPDCDWTGYCAP